MIAGIFDIRPAFTHVSDVVNGDEAPAAPPRIRASRFVTVLGSIGLAVLSATHASAQNAVSKEQRDATVVGVVSIANTDGSPIAMPGVTVTLACAGSDPRTEVSNEQGAFTFDRVVVTAACSIAADLQGFKAAARAIALTAGETVSVDLLLGLDTLREEVTVRAPLAASDARGAAVESIARSVLQTAPIAADRFQDALPLIPGVVRGPDGLLSINGSRASQTAVTFNSANGTDPFTGEEAIELPIDAVSSVQVQGAAYAPEFGLSAGAVTLVETQKGGDAWDVTVNDLEPRLRRRAGEFRGVESWTPRVTVGGPIVKGKLNLLESVQYEYSQTRVFGLPAFESDSKVQSFESFTRMDWTIGATNRFAASTMISPRKTTYAGLNTLNPQPVTPNVENRDLFATGSDQIVVGDSGVLESRVSVKQFGSTIEASQGHAPMVLAPDRNAGSYFNDQDRTGRRVEWFDDYSFTPFGPAHLVKIGGGVAYETFDGFSRSRTIEIVRASGTLSQAIAFRGSGTLGRSKTALRGYAQDAWTVAPRLSMQYGARYDYESTTGDVNVAPRGSFTLVASADGRTLIRGGGGVFYSSVPLNVAGFDQLQTRVVTRFADDGGMIGAPAELANVVSSRLRAPRSVNWNLGVDREWIANLFVRVGYQERRGQDDAVVDVSDGAIVLGTDGRSRYREGQVTARYRFHGEDQLVGSYTRSSASGNLNDFNRFFGNVEDPVIRPDAIGPLPWDAPHRVLLWASVSLPRGFAIFPVLDARTGFPLSNVDADRDFVGPRNAVGRFPTFVSLDAQVTKTFLLFGRRATIGVKIFNLTNHFNPRDYQGNLASARFGDFDNSVGRTFRGKWIVEF